MLYFYIAFGILWVLYSRNQKSALGKKGEVLGLGSIEGTLVLRFSDDTGSRNVLCMFEDLSREPRAFSTRAPMLNRLLAGCSIAAAHPDDGDGMSEQASAVPLFSHTSCLS